MCLSERLKATVTSLGMFRDHRHAFNMDISWSETLMPADLSWIGTLCQLSIQCSLLNTFIWKAVFQWNNSAWFWKLALLVKNAGACTTGGLFLYKSFIHVLQYNANQKWWWRRHLWRLNFCTYPLYMWFNIVQKYTTTHLMVAITQPC